MDFDRDASLTELLSLSRNPGLLKMSEAELSELAMHIRERHVGALKADERARDRVKRLEAKARKANSP